MDKNAIRRFAIYAREELIKRVTNGAGNSCAASGGTALSR